MHAVNLQWPYFFQFTLIWLNIKPHVQYRLVLEFDKVWNIVRVHACMHVLTASMLAMFVHVPFFILCWSLVCLDIPNYTPLPQQAKLIIHAAYGSQRHLAGFMELGLQSDQIYIHGNRRASKNPSVSNCQVSVCVGYSIILGGCNRERVDWW